TRLELVILLVIVVVLAGAIVTYLGRQRGLADEKVCANNLRRIGEALLGFHEEKKSLPAARIAPGYATWAVEIIAHLQKDSPLSEWDLARRYQEQADAPRKAMIADYFCPARRRPFWESVAGKEGGQDPAPGALGDYACASGDGDPQRDW